MISLNKIFYVLFVLMLVAGLYTYQLMWFKPADELITLLLALLCVLDILGNKNHKRYKGLFWVVGIMVFYMLYSLVFVRYNTSTAIFSDFFIQIKPFIAFYAAYAMGVRFTVSQKNFLRRLCIVLSVAMLAIILGGLGEDIFFHPAYYGIISTVLFLVYYYCGKDRLSIKDKLIMMFILAVGLLSTKAKFYGFFVVAIYITLWYKPGTLSRINIKQWIMGILVFCGVLYVTWNKINYYFISSGLFSGADNVEHSFARAALYVNSPLVLRDHLLLGSGLASYATYSSGVVGYSRLYAEYNLDEVWGLLEGDCPFVSDTFFPELAQFGIVGIVLFFYFWMWIYKQIKIKERSDRNIRLYKIGLMIILFVAIESIAGSVFLQGGGIMTMMLLGLVVREMIEKRQRIIKREDEV